MSTRDFSKLIPPDKRDALRKRLRASVEKHPVQRHPMNLQLDEADAAALLAMGELFP